MNNIKNLFSILLAATIIYEPTQAQSCTELFKQIFCCCINRESARTTRGSGREIEESWPTGTAISLPPSPDSFNSPDDSLPSLLMRSFPASPVTESAPSDHNFCRPQTRRPSSDFDTIPEGPPTPSASGLKQTTGSQEGGWSRYLWPFPKRS